LVRERLVVGRGSHIRRDGGVAHSLGLTAVALNSPWPAHRLWANTCPFAG